MVKTLRLQVIVGEYVFQIDRFSLYFHAFRNFFDRNKIFKYIESSELKKFVSYLLCDKMFQAEIISL